MAAQLFAPNNKEKRKQEDDLKNENDIKQKKFKRLSKCSEHVFRTCVLHGKYLLSITQSFIELPLALDPTFPKKWMNFEIRMS